jgi:copper transport protein
MLRRAVAGELAVGAAVLAVTALLVASVPARDALARPASAELRAGALRVEVVVDPARAGRTTVHAYTLDTTGRPVAVASLRLQLSLPTRDIGPLLVPVTRAGPGHFVGGGVDIPIRGVWTVDAAIRTEAGDRTEARGTIEVR